MASAGCLFWLQRLQPLLVLVAVAALSYQGWLVWRRPAVRRTTAMLLILWVSIASSLFVALTWISLWLRYR